MISQKLDFKKLTREQKQRKLFLFVKELDHWDETLHALRIFLEEKNNISEDFLEDTYFDLLNFAETLRREEIKKASLHLKIAKEKLKKYIKIEKEDHVKADDILKMIE